VIAVILNGFCQYDGWNHMAGASHILPLAIIRKIRGTTARYFSE